MICGPHPSEFHSISELFLVGWYLWDTLHMPSLVSSALEHSFSPMFLKQTQLSRET